MPTGNPKVNKLFALLAETIKSERDQIIYKVWKSGKFVSKRELATDTNYSNTLISNIINREELKQEEAQK